MSNPTVMLIQALGPSLYTETNLILDLNVGTSAMFVGRVSLALVSAPVTLLSAIVTLTVALPVF